METITDISVNDLLQNLKQSADLGRFFHHPVRQRIASEPLNREQVGVIVGQYWHPIHYFVTFLPKVIAAVPALSLKTHISKILWQELGEGDPARAHENLYIETMVSHAGLDQEVVCQSPPTPATRHLMTGYREVDADYCCGLGYLYGTEAIDLAIVSGLAKGVRRGTGVDDLPWLDIHTCQEPDHTASVEQMVTVSFTADEEERILQAAHELWNRWYDFFSEIGEKIY